MPIFLEWEKLEQKIAGYKVDVQTHEIEYQYEQTPKNITALWSVEEKDDLLESAIEYANKNEHIERVTIKPWEDRIAPPLPEQIYFEREEE